MVEYCEEDSETRNPPPAEEVQVETLDPPAAAAEVPIKFLLPAATEFEEVEIQSLTTPPSAEEFGIQSLYIPPQAAEEVHIEILDLFNPVDCYDNNSKRRKMTKGTKAYCLSCRKKTSMQRPRLVKMKKGQRLAGSCKNCSTKTSLIIGKNHKLAVK